jgi:hypothetical protein
MPAPPTRPAAPPTRPAAAAHRPTLAARGAVAAALFAIEVLLLSFLVQGRSGIVAVGAAGVVHTLQHWLFRFAIAYAASFAMLALLAGREDLRGLLSAPCDAPLRPRWAVLHALLLIALAGLSAAHCSPRSRRARCGSRPCGAPARCAGMRLCPPSPRCS